MILGGFKNSDVDFKVEINFDLAKWEHALGHGLTKRFLAKTLEYMNEEVDMRFLLERGPDRKKWKKLSKFTIKYKHGYRGKLKHKNTLMKSFVSSVYMDSWTISTNVPYAGVHQKGAVIQVTPKQSYWMWANLFNKKGFPFRFKRLIIPPRPFIGFGEVDERKIEMIAIEQAKRTEKLGRYPLV